MNILVIAAHPDDEVLGVGGTMARHTKKRDSVYLCIVADGRLPYDNLENEVKAANHILGTKKIFFLGFQNMRLNITPQMEINQGIEECIKKVRPDIVYTHHWGDPNKDHRTVFESTMVATRPLTNFSPKEVLCYEALSSTDQASFIPKDTFIPDVFVDITDTLDTKFEAMKAYKSEIREYPHPRSIKGLEILSRMRGLVSGVPYAEAFFLVRRIVP